MPVTALCSLFSIALASSALGGTLHVPADYSTIQACIDAAVSGVDECVVAPGTYNETINFLGKAITLRSSGGADVTTIDGTGLNSSVVTCASGEHPDAVLDGFTVTGGTGTYLPDSGLDAYVGGGMYNAGTSPTVINCTFSGNTARYGGGMYNKYSNPRVTNGMFSLNTASYAGGAILNEFSDPTMTNCTFSGNVAYYGGGMDNYASDPTVTNCTFTGNAARYDGGGMHNWVAAPTVTDCTFSGNTATASNFGYGGGMFNYYASSTVTNCTFSGNTAYLGGGMFNQGSSPTLSSCTFSGNTGHYGGGMYNYFYDGSPTVTNCILWSNSPDEILNIYSSAPTVRFSDVQGGLPAGSVDGGGNINLDPLFVRPPDPGPDAYWDGVDDDYGDLRLQAGSPCINAGDPAFVVQPGETDLDGHARVQCDRVDMGAYEFGIGDYDCDQVVNLTDFAHWAACATGPQAMALVGEPPVAPSCEAFDFDGDGDVDLFDFAGFQGTFQGSSP